jgi:hypothetical protein
MRHCYIQYKIYAKKLRIVKWEEFFTNNFVSVKCLDVEKLLFVRKVHYLRKTLLFQFNPRCKGW